MIMITEIDIWSLVEWDFTDISGEDGIHFVRKWQYWTRSHIAYHLPVDIDCVMLLWIMRLGYLGFFCAKNNQ